jgi:methylase of polypeptide subunit release factors
MAAANGSAQARSPRANSLRRARRLAVELLNEAHVGHSHDVDTITAAFERFLALIDDRDAAARAALSELQRFAWSDQPEPHFFELLERAADANQRQRRGVFFTPGPVIDFILKRVRELAPAGPLTVVDPACGAGAFLLSAASLTAERPGSRLIGFDVSPSAVAAARLLLKRAGASVDVQVLNPLLAGDAAISSLLDAHSTLVVVGNPPYANFGRMNRGSWIDSLLQTYRDGLQEQKLNLTDDFIKFVRWAEHAIHRAGRGIAAMITSRTYLSGVTHRGMRRSLLQSFPRVELIDLHGDGEPGDENVFEIRRGVAIGLFARLEQCEPEIEYWSLRGSREEKLRRLHDCSLPAAQRLKPSTPEWSLVPSATCRHAAADYLAWPRLDEIFLAYISGVQTKNDALLVDFDRSTLGARMNEHLASQAEGPAFDETRIRPYFVGPFDRRWIYYEPSLVGRPRWQVMRHLVAGPPNLALVFMRQSTSVGSYDHALVVDAVASDRTFYSRRGAPFVAPLWQMAADGALASNLSAAWSEQCERRLGQPLSPRESMAWIYATLWNRDYRQRYLPLLQQDFPRIPWPNRSERSQQAIALGCRLMDLHTASNQASRPLGIRPLDIVGESSDLRIERGYPKLDGTVVWLHRTSGLELADPSVWSLSVGGYAVLQRWLSVRRGRILSDHDLAELSRLVAIASETMRLVAGIVVRR